MSRHRQSTAPHTEHLTVVGQARLDFVPDMVELGVSLIRIADTAALAKADIDARAARVLAIARDLGLETRDLRASELMIAPHREYRDGEYHHEGYSAQREIQLMLRDIAAFNPLLSRLLEVPIDKVTGIKTRLGDPASAQQAALAGAIEDAKGKATAIASQFGVGLGHVFSINATPHDSDHDFDPVPARLSEEEAGFEPGMIEVEAKIEVTFHLDLPEPR